MADQIVEALPHEDVSVTLEKIRVGLNRYRLLNQAEQRFDDLSRQVVDAIGPKEYRNVYNPKYVPKRTDPPIVKDFVATLKERLAYERRHCRSYADNSRLYVNERLRSNHNKWSVEDAGATQQFRQEDPLFEDARQGSIKQMVDDNEIAARIVDPYQMALDFIEEFSRNPAHPHNRSGWEVVVNGVGGHWRRRVIDVQVTDNNQLLFVLDSNRYYGELGVPPKENIVTGQDGSQRPVSSWRTVGYTFARRLGGSTTREASDFKTLLLYNVEQMKDAYAVIVKNEESGVEAPGQSEALNISWVAKNK